MRVETLNVGALTGKTRVGQPDEEEEDGLFGSKETQL